MKYSVPATNDNLNLARAVFNHIQGVEVWPDMSKEITFISESETVIETVRRIRAGAAAMTDNGIVASKKRIFEIADNMYQAARLKHDTPFYHLVYLKEQVAKAEREYKAAQQSK